MFRVPLGFACGAMAVGAGVEVGTAVAAGAVAAPGPAGAVVATGAAIPAGTMVAAGAAVAAGLGVLVGLGVAVAEDPQAIATIRSSITETNIVALEFLINRRCIAGPPRLN